MLPKIDWTAFSGGARDIAAVLLDETRTLGLTVSRAAATMHD